MENKHPQPFVSIITVVFNGELTLERTILSIMALEYDALEYIVVDGDSSDGTKDIIKRYSKSISRWISEPDKGLYDAMNKGLAIAKGDYVWFLNAGDEVARPGLLKHIFDLCSDADVYYGDTMIVDFEGREIGGRRLTPPETLTWRDFRKGMLVSHQSIIISTKVAGFYDLSYRFSADFDWVLRALKKANKIVYGRMIFSRFLDGGLTKRNILPGLKERFLIMTKHYGFFSTLFNHLPIALKFIIYLIRNRRF